MLLKDYISQYESGGIDPTYYTKLAQVESSGNPNAKANTSSAAGLFQFTEGTWKELVKDLGLNYSLNDRFDPKKSAELAAEFTDRNRAYLLRTTGREPNEGELYLAHFLGAGGAGKLLNSVNANPNTSVKDVVGTSQIQANKSIFLNKDGSPKTVGQIYNWSNEKMGTMPSPEMQKKIITAAQESLARGEGYLPTQPEEGVDRIPLPQPMSSNGAPSITSDEVKLDFLQFDRIKELEQQRREAEEEIIKNIQIQTDVPQQQARQQLEDEQYAGEMDPYNYIQQEEF